jgi:hypothetical protein
MVGAGFRRGIQSTEIVLLPSVGYPRALNAIRHMDKTSDPIRTSRHAANALMVMVAGLVAIAVANKQIIMHPFHQV